MKVIVLAWILRHLAGIQLVVVTSNLERLLDSCKADTVELRRDAWYELLEAARGLPVP